ncbi:DNA/RNA non-specific endonuclease [Porphyromonas sp.]|uniref:DNA/RNA non-specific endonuclease n=1 Tax=Porphyromonas sp. TaxID=1924944 RepID=UPI0025E367E9|nr:DNA/RNA non-specific endonuclease [Porphyromonas sp.]
MSSLLYKRSYLQMLLLVGWMALLLVGCKPQGTSQPELPTELALYDRTGASMRVVSAEPLDFFVTVEAPSRWTLTASPETWLSVSPSEGNAGKQEVIVSISANEGGERKAQLTLSANGKSVTYAITQQQADEHTGGGGEYGSETILGDVSLLEAPKLSGRSSAYYITHRVEQGQRVNFSVEYDVIYHHPIWVCYSADEYTSQRHTGRSDAWSWDPFVPSQYEVTRSDFKGYDRGHIVASADRLYSEEANQQTFYYTNMSPQRRNLNTGVWLQLEQLVQGWARNSRLRDNLYVVKGGTLREDETIGATVGGITVPRYYWMAILAQRGDHYQAIAFWVDHTNPAQVDRPRTVAISIDQLEERTGLDLFHNLPDNIETRVEAAHPTDDLSLWPGI